MALTLPAEKTYAQMLQTLRSRCGLHPTIGDAPALNSILTEAHEYVYAQLDDGIPTESTLTIVVGVPNYEFESNDGDPIARGSVQEVWIRQGDTSRVPLSQGITHGMRADADLRSQPTHYGTRMVDGELTFEVWPTPDKRYTLYIKHNRIITRFSEPTDKPCVPEHLVLGYAIAMGKSHYGKADADVAGQSFKTMLSSARAEQKENKRFLPPGAGQSFAPYVVSTAGGFRQIG